MTDVKIDGEAVLSYEAPFLIEKLVKDRIADTEAEAQALFTEVKRFMFLVRTDDSTVYDMYSRRVDEAWHQFVLFTREYIDYSFECFGSYVQHSPGNAPPVAEPEGAPVRERAKCFHDFKQRYEELYGIPLPAVWYDAHSITTRRRVLNDSVGKLTVRDSDGGVDLLREGDDIVISVTGPARAALDFVGITDAFYVRELPGELTDEEKVGLVTVLVEQGILRVAP